VNINNFPLVARPTARVRVKKRLICGPN